MGSIWRAGHVSLALLATIFGFTLLLPVSVSAASATAAWYYVDPDSGNPRYDAPFHIEDGGTVAVPFDSPGYIEDIEVELEPFYFPEAELFFIPDPGDPDTRVLVAEPGYEVVWAEAGTYELDIYQIVLAPSRTPAERFFAWFVPTAHAASPGAEFVETIRFTVVESEPPAPPCCSSVLFLPGIEGSVLKDGNNTLWPATLFDVNDDLEELAFDENGEPVNNDVVVDGIVNTFPVGPFSFPVYQDFSTFMDSLTEDNGNGTIREWVPFAYDWRKPLQQTLDEGAFWESEGEVVELVETIEDLASNSKTGKVTIVAHSMGGLLGKALIKKLDEEYGEAELIDNFVMVGSPQLGTGQAVGGLLHGEGSDLVYGFLTFVNKAQARALGQNLETAYDLLPSPRYFDEVTDPVLAFGTTTPPVQEWRDFAGECLPDLFCVNDYEKMAEFLIGDTLNRDYPDPNDHKTPERLNETLVQDAEDFHAVYDDYEIPSNIRVVQIAGWGVDTIKGVKYTEDDGELDYEPLITSEGDSTVVYPSALASEGGQYYFNLFNYNETNPSTNHTNIISSGPVREMLQSVLTNASISEVDFLSVEQPPLSDVSKRLLVSAHSPVTIGVQDDEGNFTGIKPGQDPSADILVIQNDIPGSQYLTFGEGKYILLPEDGDYTFEFKGTGGGSATIKVQEIENDIVTPVATYSDIPVTPQTVATLNVSDDPIEGTPIEVDDGTGQITPVAPDDYVPPPPSGPTFEELVATLKTKVQNLNITPKLKTNLLKRIDKLEQKIAKQKEKKSKVLENLEAAIAKKVLKGKIDATSAAEITALLDELEAHVGIFPLDGTLIQELRTKIENLSATAKLKANLLKRVDRLERMTGLLLSLDRLTATITNKGTQGKIPDAEAQELLNLLTEIEGAL